MNTPTPTPRTDAAWASSFEPCEYRAAHTARTMRDCSQQLETELAALTAERDAARARAERAEDNLAALEQSFDDNCRGVVKIADELATERARLDWLESPAGMDWQWQAGITRATIDAKMQKDAK